MSICSLPYRWRTFHYSRDLSPRFASVADVSAFLQDSECCFDDRAPFVFGPLRGSCLPALSFLPFAPPSPRFLPLAPLAGNAARVEILKICPPISVDLVILDRDVLKGS